MKVSFGTSIVQKGRRIALDPNLLVNLGLVEGDRVQIYFDTDNKSVIVKKDSGDTPNKLKKQHR